MITNKQAHSKTQINKPEKVASKAKLPAQKDHQEALPVKNNPFEENRKKLQEETQVFMYNQSSKFSSVSRALILGIIGTIWIITYTDGKLFIPNRFLLISLLSGLLFLIADVFHYFLDSMSYHNESYQLDKYKTQEELDKVHEPRMNHINTRSHIFLIIKFAILLFTATFFFIGISIKASL